MNTPGFRHLLDIKSLHQQQLTSLLELSSMIARQPQDYVDRLKGKVLINLFLEPSTRTRISFEMAAKRLGMQVINFQADVSSAVKGEALVDTFDTLQAMHPEFIAVRHSSDGVATTLAARAAADVQLINAGDGCSNHPTQALLDVLTLQRAGCTPAGKTFAIVGDIKHSRVARSDIEVLTKLAAADIRLAGPSELLPEAQSGPVTHFNNIESALAGVDAIIMLRIQRERFDGQQVPDEQAYFKTWGLTPERLALAAADCKVLHPGPVNRGVEIASEVVDGPQSLIREQVGNGVYVRMAVLMSLAGSLAGISS